MSIVSVIPCKSYDLELLRSALYNCLAPLGGIEHFVKPGMRVLLKPNLVSPSAIEQAITTHPAVVQVVAELVQRAGGSVQIGDSPQGTVKDNEFACKKCGMAEAAAQTGSDLVLFESVTWKHQNGHNYFIAKPVLEADLIINLPKLKTHNLTLFTGAVKNLFGVIPGTRKREVHLRAPAIPAFSQALVDVLELVKPGLTILDGILGMEGNGPGASGTPHHFNVIAASADPVALDTIASRAMGYRPGEVLYLAEAASRSLGVADVDKIQMTGDLKALDFGKVKLPSSRMGALIPSWAGGLLQKVTRLQPRVNPEDCIGCGKCVEVCPREVITQGKPVQIDLDRCIGCLCCAETCPQGAIAVHRSLVAQLAGIGQ